MVAEHGMSPSLSTDFAVVSFSLHEQKALSATFEKQLKKEKRFLLTD
jgi:hypothetical protein